MRRRNEGGREREGKGGEGKGKRRPQSSFNSPPTFEILYKACYLLLELH
jgi:hypothetical protein